MAVRITAGEVHAAVTPKKSGEWRKVEKTYWKREGNVWVAHTETHWVRG
jgi:hypothetical protein